MLLLVVLELFLYLCLSVLAVTQMIIPSIKGTKMFPMFRKESKILSEITELNQQSAEIDLENQADTIRSTIETKRSR